MGTLLLELLAPSANMTFRGHYRWFFRAIEIRRCSRNLDLKNNKKEDKTHLMHLKFAQPASFYCLLLSSISSPPICKEARHSIFTSRQLRRWVMLSVMSIASCRGRERPCRPPLTFILEDLSCSVSW